MSFTRRQWLGASAASILGAVTAGMKLSPLAQAMAATELSPAAQLAALKAFSGTVAHATHYGPLMATVQKGRIVKVIRTESEEKFSAQGNHIGSEVKETITNKMIFNVLTPNGFKALT